MKKYHISTRQAALYYCIHSGKSTFQTSRSLSTALASLKKKLARLEAENTHVTAGQVLHQTLYQWPQIRDCLS